ncbi:hypothetical protein B382_19470 [Stutzerimonas stutzeri B1SMN1]|nr:hypothetical protein B382_19470 [Stutzerimonas stutzeri B1SMN1]
MSTGNWLDAHSQTHNALGLSLRKLGRYTQNATTWTNRLGKVGNRDWISIFTAVFLYAVANRRVAMRANHNVASDTNRFWIEVAVSRLAQRFKVNAHAARLGVWKALIGLNGVGLNLIVIDITTSKRSKGCQYKNDVLHGFPRYSDQ